MFEEQKLVLNQIVHNVIHGHYQGLSQTSLTDSLSQSLSESMVEQARLFNLLVNHTNQSQQSQDSNQHILESLLPPSKLPMDLRKEERKIWSHKKVLPRMDLNGWEITCTKVPQRDGKQSGNVSNINGLVKTQLTTTPRGLVKLMKRSLTAQCQVCFKCGECGHSFQECPSSTWSDPKDWDIVSSKGERMELSTDFLKQRELLQQLMTPGITFPSHWPSHSYY